MQQQRRLLEEVLRATTVVNVAAAIQSIKVTHSESAAHLTRLQTFSLDGVDGDLGGVAHDHLGGRNLLDAQVGQDGDLDLWGQV